jgi:ribosome recycling factor
MTMLDEIASEAKDSMEKSIEALKKQLNTIRAGRANASMLDGIKVEYYGSATPLAQVASITVADARLLIVKPWEKAVIKDVERAIGEANIGLSPQNDGEVIRLPIPALSEERRKEYAKQAKTKCEDAKVSIRNARRDANEMLKDAQKEGEVTQDDEQRGLKIIQDLTDQFVKVIDELLERKEAEILEV